MILAWLGGKDGVVPPVAPVVDLNSGGGCLTSLVNLPNSWDWAHPALLV